MKKILTITCLALLSVLLLSGCTATKIKYEKDEKGKVEYSIWHNGHWLKTEAETLGGGMTGDGQFSINLSGLKSSPSEEFNRTMQTYTTALVHLVQIAAAAYNPSASLAAQGADPKAVAMLVDAQAQAKAAEIAAKSSRETAAIKAKSDAAVAEKQASSATTAATCPDGSCTVK